MNDYLQLISVPAIAAIVYWTIEIVKYTLDGNEKFKRFIKTYSQGGIEIWVDKETGVNYIYRQSGYSGGLTVLIDNDGNPIITDMSIENKG